MRFAQTYLEIVRNRGERRLELARVYHNLQNRDLFLRAYAKLYANKGATTAGIEPADTIDGMSLKRIDKIIDALRAGTYRWKPVQRTYIPKEDGRLRPLGKPGWTDKLLQEVIRMVLNAYYEPQFSAASHGFRPTRGCHTALQSIVFTWNGTKWFIEGDIKGCFDHIDHNGLLEVMGRKIKDERFLKLLRGMLKAGYVEDWKYHQTYSGTPQGGIVSPLLANILLNELDKFIEAVLIPQYTRGNFKRDNPDYTRLTYLIGKAQGKRDIERYKSLVQERRKLPTGDPKDPDYRRLRYVRYADDFLLGFNGPKSEAKEIKQRIGDFLATIGLTMSEEKTLLTHAATQRARFLGYDVHIAWANSRLTKGRRSINGTPILNVPLEVATKWKRTYTHKGKSYHRTELINNSDYDIVTTYNQEFRGLVNYYTMAHDVAAKLYPVKWVCLQSLVKTLAVKYKRPVTWVYRKYYRRLDNGIKAIVVKVPREDQSDKPLTAKFGAKSIRHEKRIVIKAEKPPLVIGTNEIVRRLLANHCELCGSTANIEVHHLRKLKDLKQRYQGRPDPPRWVIKMIELRRKTLVVCATCHRAIHAGSYDGTKLN